MTYAQEIGGIMIQNNVYLNELIDKIINNNNEKKDQKEYQAYCKYLEMSAFENDLINRHVNVIAGIDEAGRGPIAGPVVAAAVILPNDYYLPGLNDSKQLSSKKREYFYQEIVKHAISYGIGFASVEEIDQYNIYECTKIAMKRAVTQLNPKPMHLLIDAMKLDLDIPQSSIIKGDTLSVTIAAASVLAKVTRDHYMQKLDELYPNYHFSQNAGYGTKQHMEAINEFGITPIHRKTFEPVKSLVEKQINLFNL
ncbi:MAG: Ribonuclease [Haloplasmataceae bacterium]|nr:Ribonuclease [Haloplasmataceae bacterium]